MGKLNYIFFLYFIFALVAIQESHCQWQWTSSLQQVNCFGSIGHKLFVAATPGLLVSNDSGNSWSVRIHPTLDSDIISVTSIGNKLIAEAGIGQLISMDSGETWEIISSDITFLFRVNSNLFGEQSPGLFRSTDSGTSWVSAGLNYNYILNMAAIGKTIFASTADSGVFRSTDDGLTWKTGIPSSLGVSYSYWYLAILGNIVLATATGSNTAFLSYDTGSTWQTFQIPTPNNYAGPNITSLAIYGSNIFAGYEDAIGGVTLSTDTGKTWKIIGTMDRVNSLYIFGGYIFAGTNDGGVFRASLSDFGIDAIHTSEANISKFTLLTNPITSSADFQFDALKEPIVFELFDALGRSFLRRQLPVGQTSLHVNMQIMPVGIYFARLGGETVKFVHDK